MNELAVALVVFFGSVVAFATALVGYLKVWKPLSGNGSKHSKLNLVQLLNETEHRMERQDKRIKRLQDKVAECEQSRMELMDEIRELRRENQ